MNGGGAIVLSEGWPCSADIDTSPANPPPAFISTEAKGSGLSSTEANKLSAFIGIGVMILLKYLADLTGRYKTE